LSDAASSGKKASGRRRVSHPNDPGAGVGARNSRRPRPDSFHEREAGHPFRVVGGVDEVGRGCLAGPVVAGVAVLPANLADAPAWVAEVADSKLLTAAKRAELAPKLESWLCAFGIGEASVEEIDRINIFHASHLAMARALEAAERRLGQPLAHLLVDGNVVPRGIRVACTAIVKGDQKCLSVAAASVLAKVWRDRLMSELDARHPGYEFRAHKGYSTPTHQRALEALGPCIEHRRSFAPVRAELVKRGLLPEASAEAAPTLPFGDRAGIPG
jgi:ribonuclease HII